MEDGWRVKLLKCSNELATDLSFDLISPSLIERGIITTDEYEGLRDGSSNQVRVLGLLDCLLRKDYRTYSLLLEYLHTDYDWLAAQLQSTAVNQTDIVRFQGTSSSNNNIFI